MATMIEHAKQSFHLVRRFSAEAECRLPPQAPQRGIVP
jgi:hypothetical protein